MEDIKMEDNDITIVNGDFLMTEGYLLLKQNIIRRLTTPRGSIFFNKEFGSDLYKWKNTRRPPVKTIETHVKSVLIECDEIDVSTINVSCITRNDTLLIKCSFRLNNDKLMQKLHISLDRDDVSVNFE